MNESAPTPPIISSGNDTANAAAPTPPRPIISSDNTSTPSTPIAPTTPQPIISTPETSQENQSAPSGAIKEPSAFQVLIGIVLAHGIVLVLSAILSAPIIVLVATLFWGERDPSNWQEVLVLYLLVSIPVAILSLVAVKIATRMSLKRKTGAIISQNTAKKVALYFGIWLIVGIIYSLGSSAVSAIDEIATLEKRAEQLHSITTEARVKQALGVEDDFSASDVIDGDTRAMVWTKNLTSAAVSTLIAPLLWLIVKKDSKKYAESTSQ
ncbi:hypothetical protein IKF15_02360 [Candidatus Saccharibacteria bacterium]|nr:hypothetical protein [Candidatus Saccharibacteria bacterium]